MSPTAPARGSLADLRFMDLAIALAEQARGQTHPNPVVGAVIVKNGRVLSRGYHHKAGGPHAEIEALAAVRFRAPGATLYVTLEPCCHTGRTGPCTEPIIAAGITRVVVGCRDLNPKVSGRGTSRLRKAGITVDVGCREDQCYAQNRAFFRWIQQGRPWVTMKMAATLDGFMAPPPTRRTGGITWITGPEARRAAHELRASHDAILAGAGTILADDPRLTVRLPGRRTSRLLRVVLDGRLSMPPTARLLRTPGTAAPLVIAARSGDPALARRGRALEKAGAELLWLPGRAGRVAIPDVLAALGERGVQALLVEGGAAVHGAFIEARLVDSVACFLAPRLAAGGVPVATGQGRAWDPPLRLGALTPRALGADILITADVLPPATRADRRRA